MYVMLLYISMKPITYGGGSMTDKEVELVGKLFGSLTAISPNHKDKHGKMHWNFRCACGNNHVAILTAIKYRAKSGTIDTPSCGCALKRCAKKLGTESKTHGFSGSKLYDVYINMIGRCYTTSHRSYATYGGIGVTVCNEWKSDISSFMSWAEKSYVPGLTLDKDILCDSLNISPKIYSPKTCQWVSKGDNATHSSGRRNYRNNKHIKLSCDDVKDIVERFLNGGVTRSEIAKEYGVTASCIGQTIRKNS